MSNSIKTNITQPIGDKYIKTFDVADDPVVYSIQRVSPYSFETIIVGIFDTKESALCRLNRMMDSPHADEEFKIMVHNLRTLKQEEDLN
tara:strand:- start:211 stop:477 length:267 start_codon:yes stop_codon:yes gene_type:complete